jgi:hypothetical protein
VQRLCGNLQLDISKARNLLGWVPPVSVGDGLRRVGSDRLTKSEIVSLRQSKKLRIFYVQKAFPVRCKAMLDEFNQAR